MLTETNHNDLAGTVVDPETEVREIDQLVRIVNEKVNRLLQLSTRLQPSNVAQPGTYLTPQWSSQKTSDFEKRVRSLDNLGDVLPRNKAGCFSPLKHKLSGSQQPSNHNCSIELENSGFMVSDLSQGGTRVFDDKEQESSSSEEELTPMLKDVLLKKISQKGPDEKQVEIN